MYSSLPGAVAAPTAGLHFTPELLQAINSKEIKREFLTLHVGSGTFKPIKSERATDHEMHEERIIITKKNLENLISHDGKIVVVGTTSCRTLESLYWFGVKIYSTAHEDLHFHISQQFPYHQSSNLPSRKESLMKIIEYLKAHNLDKLEGSTSIYIHPGYSFRMIDGLITNFHQPKSTLLLLIAALVGNAWKEIYEEAIDNDYRFLSYGDSSILFPK